MVCPTTITLTKTGDWNAHIISVCLKPFSCNSPLPEIKNSESPEHFCGHCEFVLTPVCCCYMLREDLTSYSFAKKLLYCAPKALLSCPRPKTKTKLVRSLASAPFVCLEASRFFILAKSRDPHWKSKAIDFNVPQNHAYVISILCHFICDDSFCLSPWGAES